LTAEWRATFAPEYRDCWGSGCHGEDAPENSFLIPEAGAPALAGPGTLTRFSNAFNLGTFLQTSMPLVPTGSLSTHQTWELTAFLMSLNERNLGDLILSGDSAAAVPLHRDVRIPGSELPGTLLLAGMLILAGIGVSLRTGEKLINSSTDRKGNFYHHLHPPRISAVQARLSYTLGAGGLAVFFSLILLVTGLLEMYYYSPTPDRAAASIQIITNLVPFGNLIRNLHYWSAQLLVITMTIHLLRVVLTGANAPPRRFNFLLGLVLLVLILLLDFTGYVLRWDEGIRWALVVGTNLLKTIPLIGDGFYQFVIGGSEPGAAALTRFYAWHIFGLTLLAGAVIVWHIFRIRRDGGIAGPKVDQNNRITRITRIELVRREVLVMLIAGAVLLVFSVLIPAPIDQPLTATGGLTGDSRAPWFFLWIQQLLKLGDPFLWGVAVPILVVIILGLLPYLLPNARKEELGRWLPAGNRIAQVLAGLIISVILILTLLGAVK
jgi:quinol-cytochrome oxidoreductase complex cytochrome b subunit